MFFKLHELIALLAIGALLVIIATGVLIKDHIFNTEAPRFPALSSAANSLADAPGELRNWLSSLGSSTFELEDRFPDQTGFVGEANEIEQYLLLNRYDGDIEKGVVDLIDLRSFQVLHRWELEFHAREGGYDETNPNHRFVQPFYADVMTKSTTHSSLLQEGELFVGRHGSISKLDACSKPQWEAPILASIPTNASLELDDHGNTWVTAAQVIHPSKLGLARSADSSTPLDTKNRSSYIDNRVIQLSPAGEVIYSKSITEILVKNHLSHLIFGYARSYYLDAIHLVDVQPAIVDGPNWKKGDLLLSLKHLSLVLLYRPSTDELLWHSIGRTNYQSDVDFAGDSKVVMFDNNTPTYLAANVKSEFVRKDLLFKMVDAHSKVLIYDFTTDQYSHHLDEALRTYEVKTAFKGRSQLLLNGDLFVEESEFGRLLYFNSDGSSRWSYVNRAEDSKVYALGSSRILRRDHDIARVRDFLAKKDELLSECR